MKRIYTQTVTLPETEAVAILVKDLKNAQLTIARQQKKLDKLQREADNGSESIKRLDIVREEFTRLVEVLGYERSDWN